MKRFIVFCVVVASALLGAPMHAQQRSTVEQGLAEALHLGTDVKLSYLDRNGKLISFNEFSKQMNNGTSFAIDKNLKAKTAALQLRAAGQAPADFQLKLKIKPGEALPTFALDSTHGRHLTNADFTGHYTLLSFYFADCLPCIAEVPTLNAFAKQHKDLSVLAVTFEQRDDAVHFAAQRGLQWDSMVDAQAWIDALGLSSYPMLLLIDPHGRLAAATISTTLTHKGTPNTDDIARWVDKHRTNVTNVQ